MEYFYYLLIVTGLIYIFSIVLKSFNVRLFKGINWQADSETIIIDPFRQILAANFIVYRLLSKNGQQQFDERICRFIRMKTFLAGANIKEITDEMRVMVAASAIQITYGYPDVYFNHFETIILFADDYYSTITGQYHKGEVNARGAIVLSWKSFLSGFSNMADGRNLALHEMAHALRLTNIVDNEEYDFIDADIMHEFEELSAIEMQKIDSGDNSFFRSYGAANLQEFFSVAVECFFELPNEYKAYNPGHYILLSQILKINLLDFKETED
jgi:MtfA peptidase